MSIWKNGKLVAGGRQTTPLLSFMWADHILDEISWLRADTFSWQRGAVYRAVYQHLVGDYNGSIVYNKAKFVKEIDPTYNYWRAMCYGGGKFVAITQDGYVTTSTDGITWATPTQNANLGSNYWWGLVYVNGTFYALGAYGRKSTSTDGVTWTANVTDSNFSGKGYFYSLIWDGTYFRAISETGYIGTSSDWTNWTFARPDELAMAGFATRCFGLAYNGSVYVVSLDNNKISTSSDFVNWTERTQVFNGSAPSRLCYDGEKFVAVRCPVSGDLTGWQICTSFDGTNWGEPRIIDNRDNMASDSSNDAAICKTTDGHYAILTFGGNFCISDTYETETIGGTTIDFITTADGHKICPKREMSNVAAIYATTGVAWYYILDETNQRFKLPRKHSQQIVRSVKNADGSWYRLYADGWVEQGGIVPPGLGTSGTVILPVKMSDTNYTVLSNNGNNGANNFFVVNTTNSMMTTEIHWLKSASNMGGSWEVKGRSAIDMSSFQDGEKHLYFYVGQFTQTALENTAGITAETLNDKVDKGHEVIAFQAPTSENNHTWYRKYADGWVEQGQFGYSLARNTTTAVTLPVPMANTNYTGQISGANTTFATASTLAIAANSTTQVNLWNYNGSATMSVNWEVKGMAA